MSEAICILPIFLNSLNNGTWNNCFNFLFSGYVSDGLEKNHITSDVSFLIYKVR